MSEGKPRSRPRRSKGGRRPGTTVTREAILNAALRNFADHGYNGATIRGVAQAADVDPALVLHFFGSKDGLFEAVLHTPENPVRQIAALVDEGEPADLGERMLRRYLELFAEQETGERLLAMISSAFSSPSAGRMLAAFMTHEVMLPVARRIQVDRPELRANLVGSQLVGMALVRYGLKVEPLASAPAETVVAWMAPVLQRYLSGDIGSF